MSTDKKKQEVGVKQIKEKTVKETLESIEAGLKKVQEDIALLRQDLQSSDKRRIH